MNPTINNKKSSLFTFLKKYVGCLHGRLYKQNETISRSTNIPI